jgi:hypothetical protein
MERFHHLAADTDIPPEELSLAQGECALALGRLDGLLAGLTDTEKRLFCVGLLREVLLSALAQAGFADAEHRFNAWFAGLDRGPQETPLTACSAYSVVRALLGELSHHPWEPLADAAQTIALAARFGADRPMQAEDALAEEAIGRALTLVKQAGADDETMPFARLGHLSRCCARSAVRAAGAHRAHPFAWEPRGGDRAGRPAHTALGGRCLAGAAADRVRRMALASLAAARSAETLRPQLLAKRTRRWPARALHASATRLAELVSKCADGTRR